MSYKQACQFKCCWTSHPFKPKIHNSLFSMVSLTLFSKDLSTSACPTLMISKKCSIEMKHFDYLGPQDCIIRAIVGDVWDSTDALRDESTIPIYKDLQSRATQTNCHEQVKLVMNTGQNTPGGNTWKSLMTTNDTGRASFKCQQNLGSCRTAC